MRQVKFGDTSSIVFTGRSFNGITLPFYLQNTTANTVMNAVLLTLQNIRIKAVLYQDGVLTTLCDDNLRNLTMFSTFGKDSFRQFSDSQYAYSKILLAAASGVKELVCFPAGVDFGSVINLRGNDSLTVEYTIAVAAAQTLVDTTASYATLDLLDAVGVQEYIPVISSKVIPLNDTQFSQGLGDFVSFAMFANYDKETYLAADNVVSNLNFSSDKYKRNDNAYEIIQKQRSGQFIDAKIEPFNSICIYSGIPVMGAQLDLSLTGANVTTSNNFVIWLTTKTNLTLQHKADAMRQKHFVRNQASIRANS